MCCALQSGGCMSHSSKQALCIYNARGLDPVARELHALPHKQGTLALHLGCVQSLQASSSAFES